MPIIVGIDGTGTGDDAEYAATFKTGFVRTICGKPSPNTKYFRGPTTLGDGLMPAIQNGYYFILDKISREKNLPILMTGYSRGGAGVIEIARKLGLSKIKVKALLLFDAVDRHLEIDATAIPTTVENVLHVRRDPRTNSRVSFGNCGVAHFPPTIYKQEFFMCSHGGMGGTPWQRGFNRPEAFINEGFETAQGTGLVPVAANSALRIDGITNVTYIQDEVVSKKVWSSVHEFIIINKFM